MTCRPLLVDAADDSDHEDADVPALLTNVVMSMPSYPISNELCIRYPDDIVHNDNTTTTNNNTYNLCYQCHLPYIPPYENHMYECSEHIYCQYHNRWEGLYMGISPAMWRFTDEMRSRINVQSNLR